MQQTPCESVGSSTVASEMATVSSLAKSDIKLEENLTILSEMFPAHDIDILRNHLEIFHGNPNCMSIVVGMLLEVDSTSNMNSSQGYSEQNSSQQQHSLKRKIDTANNEDTLHNKDQRELVAASPSKLKKVDSSTNETKCLSSSTVLRKEEELDINSNKSETLTSPGSHSVKKEEPSTSNSDKSEPGPLRSSGQFTGKSTSSDDKDDDDEIVFVKSIASSPKQSFYRTEQCNSATTSPKQHNGICIRHKGGVLHPSMNKPKRLQIVRINVDGTSNVQSPLNKDQSKLSVSPRRKISSSSKMCSTKAATATATTASNDSSHSSPKPCTSKGMSTAEEKATEKPATINLSECPGSPELPQTEEVTPSYQLGEGSSVAAALTNHVGSEGSSVAAALSDLEILKKVFPDADPTYISSLLDKHADKPNRVALVGKELGSNTVTREQKSKKVASTVTWFWESESGKLVPFTDSECNVLEREFNTWDPYRAGESSVKHVRLPGSAKRFTVDFNMMEMVCDSGQKMVIFRVPGGSDERKEIG